MSNQIIQLTRPNNQLAEQKAVLLDEEQLEKEEQAFEDELRQKLFNNDSNNNMATIDIKDDEEEEDEEIEEMDDYPDEIQQIQEES